MQHRTLLLPLLLLAACGGERQTSGDTSPDDTDVDDGTCIEDEECGSGEICEEGACVDGDRDDSFTEATSIFITEDDPTSGEINPAGDEDYYVLTTVQPEWVRIQTITDEESDDGLNTVVSVYNASGALHVELDDYGTGSVSTYDTVLHAYLPYAGTWYIKVADRVDDDDDDPAEGGPDFDYTLEVKAFTGVTDETDAFDDPSSSVDLSSGSRIWSVGVLLEVEDDADYIAVQVNWDEAPLEIYGLSSIPGSTAEPLVRTYDETGELILEKAGVGPEGPAFYFDVTPQTYIVEATHADGGAGDAGWYMLYLRTRDGGTSYWTPVTEPNDDFENAEEVALGSYTTSSGTEYFAAFLQGTIEAAGDEDWLAVDVPDGEWLSVQCSADYYGSISDLAVEVLDASGAVLDSMEDGSDSAPDLNNVGPLDMDTYRVRLYPQDEDVGLAAYYICRIYVTPFEIQ